jgi:hypothetical protein
MKGAVRKSVVGLFSNVWPLVLKSLALLRSQNGQGYDKACLLDELSQLRLHNRPRNQPMLVGYGDDHLRSYHAVLTPEHFVREAPRSLISNKDRFVLSRRPLDPRQQRRRIHRRIHAERSCHGLHPFILTRGFQSTLRPGKTMCVLRTQTSVCPRLPTQSRTQGAYAGHQVKGPRRESRPSEPP